MQNQLVQMQQTQKTQIPQTQRRQIQDKQPGFSLIELMVVISIASIMLLIAAPSFSTLSSDSRAFTAANCINKDLMYARNQAVNNGVQVTACPLNGQKICTSNWLDGVAVFIDSNENNQLDGNETLLKAAEAFHTQDSLSFSQNSVRFSADGLAANVSGSAMFKYCNDDGSVKAGVVISGSGRSTVIKTKEITSCR